jgi:hypothetical protein
MVYRRRLGWRAAEADMAGMADMGRKLTLRIGVALLFTMMCAIVFHLTAHGAMAVGFGALGDSLTDEYLGASGDLTQTDLPALSWVQLLARERGLDFGAFSDDASRGEPRNQGYAYNWARAGGTAREAPFFLTGGDLATQTPGLQPGVANGNVEIVFLGVGHNDYFYRDYLEDFDLEVGNNPELFDTESSDILTFEQQVLDAIMGSVDAILAAHVDAKVVLAYLPPDTLLSVEYIAEAMARLNGRLETEVALRAGEGKAIELVDLYAWSSYRYDAEENLLFGGYAIPRDSKASLDQTTPGTPGEGPCDSQGNCATLEYALNLVAHDTPGGHPGTIMQGLIANEVLAAVNPWLDTPVAPLTDDEILGAAAVVPEPGATLSLGIAIAALAALRSRGRSRPRNLRSSASVSKAHAARRPALGSGTYSTRVIMPVKYSESPPSGKNKQSMRSPDASVPVSLASSVERSP